MAVLLQVLLVACASLAYGFTFSTVCIPGLMIVLLLAWSPLAAIPVALACLAAVEIASMGYLIPDAGLLIITNFWGILLFRYRKLLPAIFTNAKKENPYFGLVVYWSRFDCIIGIFLLSLLLVRGIDLLRPLLGAALFFLTSFALRRSDIPDSPWTWRSALATTAMFFFSLLAGFIMLEFGARLLPNAPPKIQNEINIQHPRRIYMRMPNYAGDYTIPQGKDIPELKIPFKANQLGLCDREYGSKAPDEFRIAMIGDSYIEGLAQPEPERITRQVEQLLNAKNLPKKVTVLNLGLGGYGPWQERDLLQELGFNLQPDLVVLQLFMGNDIENTLAKSERLLKSYHAGAQAFLARFRYQKLGPVRADRWLYRHSEIYRRLSTMLNKPCIVADMFRTFRFLTPCRIPSPPRSLARNSNLEPNLREWYPDLEDGWAQMKEDIRGIRQDCKERGIGFIVFDIPCQQIIIDSDWQVVMDTSTNTPNLYERDKCEHLVDAFCREEGIPFIPLIAPLRNQSNREELYHHFDGHLTSRGARLTAETIAQFLLDGQYLTQK